ncbi:MAG TPA: VWA domain-containing protein [Rhodobacteraceae bacterium]|nr:VWA domain-containing protein [Paracoccaceae bacterium]
MLKKLTIAGLVAASFTGATAQEMPYPDTIIVLDVSNSMWGQIDGIAKILIAREVIGDLVTDLEEDIDFGLVAYGHRAKADCGDIETIVPVGDLNPAGFKTAVNGLQPQGRTPLTAAVRQAAEQLNYTTRSARIVLVSDGVESCDGNPAALAAELGENALDLTVHVIGFDVSGIDDQSGLEALATLNGGLYLTPDTSNELKEDLNSMMEMPTDGMAHDDDGAMSDDMMAATLMAPDTIGPRSRITVAFTGPMGSGDYIGISEAGADDVLAITRAGSTGSATLIAPRAAGRYELRYYTAEGEVLAHHMIDVM